VITRRERGWLLPGVGLVVIAAVTMAVAGLVSGGGGSATETVPAADGRQSDGGRQRLAPDSPPLDGVTLPDASDYVDGYPVGFPYSDLGAAATAVAVTRAQIGFDYDQATDVARIYAAGEDRAAVEDLSRDAVAARRQRAGGSASGDVPAPASYAATPIAFTVAELGVDYYAVNVLSYSTLTHVNGTGETLLYAGTQLVRWVGGDWKLVDGSDADIQRLIDQGQPAAAVPGTPAFERAGWIPIRGATS
jgi:hypothetical protein